MERRELEGLARATCSWLAYKHLTNLRSLYEMLLLIPISEYLSAATSWVPETELAYRSVFDDSSLPESYGDIVATRKGGTKKFVLETKLLRDQADKRKGDIEADIRRLAFPQGRVARFFMLAGRTKHFPRLTDIKSIPKPRLYDRLLRFNYKEGFEIPIAVRGQVQDDGPMAPLDESLTRRSYVRRCADSEVSVDDDQKFKVVIWSISAYTPKLAGSDQQ